ncbi:hypothetical protein COZ40_01800 [Candidatus Roizmanbacteria bacterium CG_4_10_14_3_um_filter_39_13]|uniref:Uncharacterized protein n=1 Tax=Candidatus Roizmanbacteria bacterium CG_4_10_14_3_um_filter_39_13 TaxID=1974831 RepID=A0A2M7LKZ3_9BACT|nr:MAG: hypothetical protein COZ40_01800 [Candidatus Roizmanbacteria bacterium CG_4_10_14_3_um_filter_39_13]
MVHDSFAELVVIPLMIKSRGAESDAFVKTFCTRRNPPTTTTTPAVMPIPIFANAGPFSGGNFIEKKIQIPN